MGEQHGLSFYDAMFVAAAQETQASLVSADRRLLGPALAESAGAFAHRIGLIDPP